MHSMHADNQNAKDAAFCNFLQQHVGKRIFLNADNLKPYILKSVYGDCLQLIQESDANKPGQTFIIPYSAIVSLQEIEGLRGLVIYLIR